MNVKIPEAYISKTKDERFDDHTRLLRKFQDVLDQVPNIGFDIWLLL